MVNCVNFLYFPWMVIYGGGVFNSRAKMLNHRNKFMLFRLCYIVITFLSMNEETHEFFNIPLCVSSQNDSLLHP